MSLDRQRLRTGHLQSCRCSCRGRRWSQARQLDPRRPRGTLLLRGVRRRDRFALRSRNYSSSPKPCRSCPRIRPWGRSRRSRSPRMFHPCAGAPRLNHTANSPPRHFPCHPRPRPGHSSSRVRRHGATVLLSLARRHDSPRGRCARCDRWPGQSQARSPHDHPDTDHSLRAGESHWGRIAGEPHCPGPTTRPRSRR